eukprot:TRINITY_DN31725_c0_g2_i1.p1 TRINITY_DN31725_c0_g2~~TRINITY_DN31725_c0_g2_i1.p1  ORF type:complete len:912 (+),score=126.20 TRINITY_DN31725_c0_g2_i1:252-2738(+)
MAERLERMNDFCEECMRSDCPVEIDPLTDPWHEAHPAALAQRLNDLTVMIQAERQFSHSLRRARENVLFKSIGLWTNADDVEQRRLFFASWAALTKDMVGVRKKGGDSIGSQSGPLDERGMRRSRATPKSQPALTTAVSSRKSTIGRPSMGKAAPVGKSASARPTTEMPRKTVKNPTLPVKLGTTGRSIANVQGGIPKSPGVSNGDDPESFRPQALPAPSTWSDAGCFDGGESIGGTVAFSDISTQPATDGKQAAASVVSNGFASSLGRVPASVSSVTGDVPESASVQCPTEDTSAAEENASLRRQLGSALELFHSLQKQMVELTAQSKAGWAEESTMHAKEESPGIGSSDPIGQSMPTSGSPNLAIHVPELSITSSPSANFGTDAPRARKDTPPVHSARTGRWVVPANAPQRITASASETPSLTPPPPQRIFQERVPREAFSRTPPRPGCAPVLHVVEERSPRGTFSRTPPHPGGPPALRVLEVDALQSPSKPRFKEVRTEPVDVGTMFGPDCGQFRGRTSEGGLGVRLSEAVPASFPSMAPHYPVHSATASSPVVSCRPSPTLRMRSHSPGLGRHVVYGAVCGQPQPHAKPMVQSSLQIPTFTGPPSSPVLVSSPSNMYHGMPVPSMRINLATTASLPVSPRSSTNCFTQGFVPMTPQSVASWVHHTPERQREARHERRSWSVQPDRRGPRRTPEPQVRTAHAFVPSAPHVGSTGAPCSTRSSLARLHVSATAPTAAAQVFGDASAFVASIAAGRRSLAGMTSSVSAVPGPPQVPGPPTTPRSIACKTTRLPADACFDLVDTTNHVTAVSREESIPPREPRRHSPS